MKLSIKNLWGEPVAMWGAVQAVLVAMEAFGWLSFIGIHGQPAMAALVAVISAVALVQQALMTHHTLLAPLIQVTQAFTSFLAIYGTHVSGEQTALIVAAITAISAWVHRSATSPVDKASLTLAA